MQGNVGLRGGLATFPLGRDDRLYSAPRFRQRCGILHYYGVRANVNQPAEQEDELDVDDSLYKIAVTAVT